uniref:Uncharacterized protein n=1 Tax=Anguilla anguilla TaxID=7936 RepID=A0A0E9PB45_ANGAN
MYDRVLAGVAVVTRKLGCAPH